jgi:hypothetical protein
MGDEIDGAWPRGRARLTPTQLECVKCQWLLTLVFNVLDDPPIPPLSRIELAQRLLRNARRCSSLSTNEFESRTRILADSIDRLFRGLVEDSYYRWTHGKQLSLAIVAYGKGRSGRKQAAVARAFGLRNARQLRRGSVSLFGCLPTGRRPRTTGDRNEIRGARAA